MEQRLFLRIKKRGDLDDVNCEYINNMELTFSNHYSYKYNDDS